MKIEQIYTGCLAQGAYYIVSGGQAAIVDPLRETDPYLERIERDGVKLKYIFETHFHADFVSGHLDLSKKTGAPIIYGPTASPSFEAVIACDGEIFQLGNVWLKVLHTPGHTMESSCYLLLDNENQPHSLFSGDTLFLGDVGRPDLAQKATNMTQEELAGKLYDSLYTKILPLPDSVMVYPAHGAGSACGKNMQKETHDLLGNQKKTNYALNQPSKDAFINAVLDGLSAPPAYFGANVTMNKTGYESFENVKQNALNPLSVDEFERIAKENHALILDTRDAQDFAKCFIPSSVNIGLRGDFAPWVGAIIADVHQPLLIVCTPGTEEEVITRLARVGFDNVKGYLHKALEAWETAGKSTHSIQRISAEEFVQNTQLSDKIIDVRKPTEYHSEHLQGAENLPLAEIEEWGTKLNEDQAFALHCAGGYRSMIAASVLRAKGIKNFVEIQGGFAAINKIGTLPTTKRACPSK